MAPLITAVATLALVAAGDGSQPSPLDTQADPGQTEMTEEEPPAPAYTVWDRLAQCESSGNWHSASNPIYKGGLQFDAQTWARHGGLSYAWRADFATREQQIAVAERTLAAQGFRAWPTCARRMGLI